jgi:hypothetical protein
MDGTGEWNWRRENWIPWIPNWGGGYENPDKDIRIIVAKALKIAR